jgi:protein-disulfide isomerase
MKRLIPKFKTNSLVDDKDTKSLSPAINKTNKIQYILMILLVLAAFVIGSLWTKVNYLEDSNGSSNSIQADPQAVGDSQANPPEDTTPKKVSIDDDPILGNKDAKVTMIDFTDYECPFCKRYFDETFSEIKKNYIDTGKIKYVVRDLPLSFHANAHKEAQAAECAREQGGDDAYFKYHDEIFKRTTSNGAGIALTDLSVIADDIGLSGAALQACLDSEKYKKEVDKDLADASSVGATGTPSFFIGKSSSDGVITGTPIIGAQPYSEFQTEIDKQLK